MGGWPMVNRLVVLSADYLTCPEDQIQGTQVLQTFLAGKSVFERK